MLQTNDTYVLTKIKQMHLDKVKKSRDGWRINWNAGIVIPQAGFDIDSRGFSESKVLIHQTLDDISESAWNLSPENGSFNACPKTPLPQTGFSSDDYKEFLDTVYYNDAEVSFNKYLVSKKNAFLVGKIENFWNDENKWTSNRLESLQDLWKISSLMIFTESYLYRW